MASLSSLLNELTSRIETMRSGNETPNAVATGFTDLDRVMYGFQKGKLYVIAGRPAVGLTAFMVNLVRNMLLQSKPAKKVAVFSLDFSARVILEKLLACTTEIWLEKIIRGKLDDHEWEKLNQQGIIPLLTSPLSLVDDAALSETEIKQKCGELINEKGLDILFIDNLQEIKKEKGLDPDEGISKTMRSLKDLARTWNIPIVVLSRMSRLIENKTGRRKKPEPSDIEDIGPLRQAADAVLFLYRPEYYDIIEDESGESVRGLTYIRIAKNRMGNTDTIRLLAKLHIQKFEEYEIDDIFSFKEQPKKIRHPHQKSKQNGTLFDKKIKD